jgi:hypothetical protein
MRDFCFTIKEKVMREQIIAFKANPQSVDMASRTIRDVILAAVGEAKGHGFSVESKFLDELVKQSASGIKSNFGHNWNNMGLQFGRVNNVRRDGDNAVGDLVVYENADKSPIYPMMGTWAMNQAQEDPESIMLSIRFQPSHYYQYDDKGKEVKCRYSYYDGVQKEFKDKPVYIALKKLYSIDLVDEGALTDKMFSEERGFLKQFADFLKKDSNMDNETTLPVAAAKRPDEVIDGVPPVIEAAAAKTEATIELAGKTYKATDITGLLTELAAERREKEDNTLLMQGLKARVRELETENKGLKALPAAELTNGMTGGIPPPPKAADPEVAALASKLRTKAGF